MFNTVLNQNAQFVKKLGIKSWFKILCYLNLLIVSTRESLGLIISTFVQRSVYLVQFVKVHFQLKKFQRTYFTDIDESSWPASGWCLLKSGNRPTVSYWQWVIAITLLKWFLYVCKHSVTERLSTGIVELVELVDNEQVPRFSNFIDLESGFQTFNIVIRKLFKL